MKLIRRTFIGLVALIALALPAAALAGNPSSGSVLGEDPGGAVSSGGTLPFTGLGLVPIVAAGAGLLVLGIVLRRRSRDNAA
jgi:hypothetical protein